MADEERNDNGTNTRKILEAKEVREMLMNEALNERLPVLDAYDELLVDRRAEAEKKEKLKAAIAERDEKIRKLQDVNADLVRKVPIRSAIDETDPLGGGKTTIPTLDDLISEAKNKGKS